MLREFQVFLNLRYQNQFFRDNKFFLAELVNSNPLQFETMIKVFFLKLKLTHFADNQIMSFSKFNHNITNVIFGSFMMPEELWPEDRLNVKWYSLANYDMATMTKVIKEAIVDQTTPKNILVCSYQK